MRGIISWFARNPVAANLLMVIMFFAGVFGYLTMEREFIPTTTVNGITVSVSWPGASPRDVSEQIVSRVEESIDGLDGIDYIESNSFEGGGSVNIRTKLSADYEKALDEVKNRVDGIRNLPQDSFRPQVFRWEARPDIMYLALIGEVDALSLQREAVRFRRRITELSGLQLTELNSKQAEQVTVEVSEDALRRFGLTFNEVSTAIQGSSVNLSAGSVETTGGDLQLRARSLADTEDEFGRIIVRQTSDGGTVRVRDIARVIDGFEDDDFTVTVDGRNAAVFRVLSPDVSDITEAGENIREFEKRINEELPPGFEFRIWFDGSTLFDSRMELIGSNALSGMALVLLILMLFLRPAVAFWVTVGIATAFAGAIGLAPHVGVTLNMLSLFAFLLVIGIVVDDAIVVGESVHFHNENGIEGERAAIGGANMVAKPIFFAVVTTIMMFIPFMLLTGPIRAITEQISLVVIVVLIFSLIEAFFILPAHLRHLRHVEPSRNRILRFQQRIADGLVHFAKTTFRRVVAFLIRWRYITLSTFVGLFAMSMTLLVSGVAPRAFLPEVQGDMIQVSARFPEGTNFERIAQVRDQIADGIQRLNADSQELFGISEDVVALPGLIAEGREIEGYLALSPADTRSHVSTKEIAEKLEEYVGPVPDAYRVNYGYTEAGGGSGDGLFYAVASPDEEDLRAAIMDLKTQLEGYSQVPQAWDSLESSASEIRFTLKPGAETLGITLGDVTRQVRQAFFGQEVQRLPRNGEDVRVMVRYPEAARESIDSLDTLRIRAPGGVEVPLFSVADVSFAEGVSRIQRRDRQQVEYTGGRVRGEADARAQIRADIEENFLPGWRLRHPNATRIEVGDDEIERNLVRELQVSGGVIFVLMYVLLAIAFKSYAQPLLIMIAIPFALVGMIFGNIITDVPFGMFSLFGFFAASGVAVNDNLVLIDYVNRLRAKGVGAYQAMLDACVARFRPILLTSVTTFVGITPILFETSTQAEFLKPMVVALAFGVLFDFFLTLMLVPAMYGIGVDITRFFRGLWRGEKQPGFGSTYDPDMAVALDEFEDAVRPGQPPRGGGLAPAE